MSGYCHFQHAAKHLFSPVVFRHPKAASKACHAQTSCAHPPTLGQAGLRARAELQLLTRELVVVISESYKFWERTESVPVLMDVSPSAQVSPGRQSCSGSRTEGCPLGSHPAGCRGSDAGAAPALLHLLLSGLCPTGAPCTAQGNTATIPHSVSTAFAQGAGVVSPQGFVGIFYPFCSPFNESVPGWK